MGSSLILNVPVASAMAEDQKQDRLAGYLANPGGWPNHRSRHCDHSM
jgi:hypothetical protein